MNLRKKTTRAVGCRMDRARWCKNAGHPLPHPVLKIKMLNPLGGAPVCPCYSRKVA